MLKAKKSFSQNWLVDKSAVKKIIAAAEIKSGEAVLEIGPGQGILTRALVEAGARVTAVEADKDLIKPLQEEFGDRIKLKRADILSLDLAKLGLRDRQYKLVANLPYNITAAILEKFLSQKPKPGQMVLMVQKEVAERITAKPPQMSLLSVACQIYADTKKIANVPAGSFRPAPKVDSAVVNFNLRPKTKGENTEAVIALAKIGFRSRRKQLQRNLADAQIATSDQVKLVLKKMNLPEQARAENLTVDNWRTLFGELS